MAAGILGSIMILMNSEEIRRFHPPPPPVTLVRQQEGPGTKRSNYLRTVGEIMYHLPQKKTLLCVSAMLGIKCENHEVHKSEMTIRERPRKAENL